MKATGRQVKGIEKAISGSIAFLEPIELEAETQLFVGNDYCIS
jgi:hypothetical protein